MDEVQDKLKAYTNPWWGNYEIAVISGLGHSAVSGIKVQVRKRYGSVLGFPQKVYRDDVCKYLHINIEQELRILKGVRDGTAKKVNT